MGTEKKEFIKNIVIVAIICGGFLYGGYKIAFSGNDPVNAADSIVVVDSVKVVDTLTVKKDSVIIADSVKNVK